MATRKIDKEQDKIIENLTKAVHEAESVLESLVETGDEESKELKETLQALLDKAGNKFKDAENTAISKGKEAFRYTENTLESHPWQSIGIAGLAGLVIGILISKR